MLLILVFSCILISGSCSFFDDFSHSFSYHLKMFEIMKYNEEGYQYQGKSAEDDREIAKMTAYLKEGIIDNTVNKFVLNNRFNRPLELEKTFRIEYRILTGNISARCNSTLQYSAILQKYFSNMFSCYDYSDITQQLTLTLLWSKQFSLIHDPLVQRMVGLYNKRIVTGTNNPIVIMIDFSETDTDCSWWEPDEFEGDNDAPIPRIYRGLLHVTPMVSPL